MSEPKDVIIVTVRGTRSEREQLLEQAKDSRCSLNCLARQQLGLGIRPRRKRPKKAPNP